MMEKSRDPIDALVDAFESEWRTTSRPDIGAYLARAAEPMRWSLLRELVALDLEYRLRAGEAARVEECLHRFPELTAEAAALDLIVLEYRVRQDCAERVTIAEYLGRFP